MSSTSPLFAPLGSRRIRAHTWSTSTGWVDYLLSSNPASSCRAGSTSKGATAPRGNRETRPGRASPRLRWNTRRGVPSRPLGTSKRLVVNCMAPEVSLPFAARPRCRVVPVFARCKGALLCHVVKQGRAPEEAGRPAPSLASVWPGHPASIVPVAYSSVPKTGENRRTSRPHLALHGTTWHKAPPTCTRTCAFEGPLGSPRRAIQPSSREKTAHDLRVGELQWPPEDGENVTNRTVNALKTGQNAEIGNAAVRAASGERAARARLPITVIDRQSLGEALAWWRKSYAT